MKRVLLLSFLLIFSKGFCGDGIIESNEVCDDGNDDSEDGCDCYELNDAYFDCVQIDKKTFCSK